MLTITKRVDFHAAHRLHKHEGKCFNLHGHTYVLDATFGAINSIGKCRDASPAKEGMIEDFYDVKKLLNNIIVDELDHALLVDNNSQDQIEVALKSMAVEHGLNVVNIGSRTTSENLAVYIYDKLSKNIAAFSTYKLLSIRLYETDTSWVDYDGEE